MKELVFATHNNHKSAEIQSMMEGLYRIIDLEDLNYHNNIPEESETLEGNASMKAWHVHRILGKDCFADDTGLEVESLEGAPGVYSARYAELSGERQAGESASTANIRKLLKELENEEIRKARFRTVICLILEGREVLFEGMIEGTIIRVEKGLEGFGYDPVFLPAGHNETFAEMSIAEKNVISHRANAVRKLVYFLKGP